MGLVSWRRHTDSVQPFSSVGHFWAQDNWDRKVTGRLTFDGASIDLVLFDDLVPVGVPEDGVSFVQPQREEHKLLHGRLVDGDHPREGDAQANVPVTLVDVTGIGWNFPAAESTHPWDVDCMILGAHTTENSTSKARLYFNGLKSWAAPPFLADIYRRDGVVTANIKEAELHRAEVAGATYRLLASMRGTWGLDVHLERRTSIEVEKHEPALFGDLHSQWVRPLHDLLIVCLGVPVALEEIQVDVETIWGGTRLASLVYGARQDTSHREISAFRLRGTGTEALLFPEDEPADFAHFVPEWLELRADLAKVIEPMTSVFYSGSIYGEHRYANTFKAAEELAKKSFNTLELPKAEHRKRVNLVLKAAKDASVDEKHILWADRILRSRNDSPLRALVDKLIADAGAVGLAIYAAVPDAGREMAAARTAVSHGGMQVDTSRQHWYGELLMMVLRLHLLREIGLAPEVVEARVLNSRSFQRAIAMLQHLSS